MSKRIYLSNDFLDSKKPISSISMLSCHHPEVYYSEIVNSFVMISDHKPYFSSSLDTWFLVYLLSYQRKIYKLSVLLFLCQPLVTLLPVLSCPPTVPKIISIFNTLLVLPFFSPLWSPNKSQPWINQAIYHSLFLISECQALFRDHKPLQIQRLQTLLGFRCHLDNFLIYLWWA